MWQMQQETPMRSVAGPGFFRVGGGGDAYHAQEQGACWDWSTEAQFLIDRVRGVRAPEPSPEIRAWVCRLNGWLTHSTFLMFAVSF